MNHEKEFTRYMDQLSRRHDNAQVFHDFLDMAICGFHRINVQSGLEDKDPENEALYLDVIRRYSKDDLNILSRLLGTLMLHVYDNPYSDLPGEYFMVNITRGKNGQFFTPIHICDMMARMQGEPGTIKHRNIIDPACGSGRMLLRFANINPDNYFYGADNAVICAKMAALNFFLGGLRGEIAWMNSLTMEWYGGWHINTKGLGIVPIEKEQSRIWTKAPELKKDHQKNSQLSLF